MFCFNKFFSLDLQLISDNKSFSSHLAYFVIFSAFQSVGMFCEHMSNVLPKFLFQRFVYENN